MPDSCDVAIVGAGLAGLTLAALLADTGAGLRVMIVDRGAPPAKDWAGLQVSALSPASSETLERCGVWRAVRRGAAEYRAMRVWEAGSDWNAADAVRFSAREFGLDALGHIVANLAVRALLVERLEALDVGMEWSATLEGIYDERSGIVLDLDRGRSVGASLVVGADGARSVVRRLAGIATAERDYRQHGFVTHVTPERSHRDTAWQRFSKAGPLALLPLADGRVSIVWSVAPEFTESLLSMSDERLSGALSDASQNVLGRLTAAGDRAAFALGAVDAERYAAERIVLIGDAAHRVHTVRGPGGQPRDRRCKLPCRPDRGGT